MLNPSMTLQRLISGHPAATMTLAAPRPAFSKEGPAAQDRGWGAPAERETRNADTTDVHDLAQRVYDLMRRDLMIERHRRGQWPW